MNKYKINYKNLQGKQASIFVKASSIAAALKKFRNTYSCYKAEGAAEYVTEKKNTICHHKNNNEKKYKR